MKQLILFLALLIFSFASFGQNVGIGTDTPNPSAKLEVSSPNSGFLPPRLTSVQRDSISNPAEGLQIYNLTSKCLQMFSFGVWQNVFCATNPNIIESILTNGLVAYYPFNGNVGDSSGNGNHGTVVGATLTNDRIGNPNSCYSFDGINNEITIDNNSLFTFTNFSISCWVLKSPNSIYMPGIISKCTSLNSGWYLITNTPRIDSLTFGGALSNGNYFNAFGPKLINDLWYHIACVYSNGLQKLYVNGVLVSLDTNAGPLYNNSEKIRIGFKNGDGHWKGKIDDVRLYNRILSDQEIAYLATH